MITRFQLPKEYKAIKVGAYTIITDKPINKERHKKIIADYMKELDEEQLTDDFTNSRHKYWKIKNMFDI